MEPAGPPSVEAPKDGELPVTDAEGAIVPVNQDVIAFDELFQKFCGAGSKHQFAYFDDCWSKGGKDGKMKDGKSKDNKATAQSSAQEQDEGELVAPESSPKEPKEPKEKP